MDVQRENVNHREKIQVISDTTLDTLKDIASGDRRDGNAAAAMIGGKIFKKIQTQEHSRAIDAARKQKKDCEENQ